MIKLTLSLRKWCCMRVKIATVLAAYCLGVFAICYSAPPVTQPTAYDRARLPFAAAAQTSGDDKIIALRQQGPAGLDALFEQNASVIADLRPGRIALDDDKVKGLRTKLDTVAKQRDEYASQLYWYTDLDVAKAEAAKTGRHILSLRLLGNLDQEFSCANSRFFRTVLYANTAVADHLREHYVLHWKSVRPAPLVTIDMGDGRRIQRTITGNSIHYVLDSDGTVLDALPGLYGPQAFLAELTLSESLSRPDSDTVRQWHQSQANGLRYQWLSEAALSGLYGEAFATRLIEGSPSDIANCLAEAFPNQRANFLLEPVRRAPVVPEAKEAPLTSRRKPTEFEPRAAAKSMVERPISRKTSPGAKQQDAVQRTAADHVGPPVQPSDLDRRPLAVRMTDDAWQKLATLRTNDARLDESSRRLMIAKLPRKSVSDDERAQGGVVNGQTPFARTLAHFEEAIALDTVRNEYQFHLQIHEWLARDKSDHLRHDVEALNQRVYTDLFLTPDFDAWLGLVPDDTYTALEKDGCACDKGAPPMR